MLVIPAGATPVEDILDTNLLEELLPEEAEEYMRDLSPITPPDGNIADRIWMAIRDKAEEAAGSVLKTAGILLVVCILIALSNTLDLGGNAPQYIIFAGVAAIGATALSDFDSYLNVGMSSLSSLTDYAGVLLPVLASAAAASGSIGGAAAKYGATALFIHILLETARRVIVPCVCAFAALAVADAAVGNQVLKTTKKLMKSVCNLFLTGISLAFTAWLTLSGVVADTADALTTRMTKTAVSTALPVVGSILSDAAGTLAAAAGALRGSIGIFGILAVIFLCISPFVTLGARYLAYKLSAAVCGCVSDKRLTALVEDLGTCFGMILALNGAGALMVFISIYSLIRTAI